VTTSDGRAAERHERKESPGTASSTAALAEETYAELWRIARRYMRSQRHDHTLQPTALVHEGFLRLSGRGYAWTSRAEFLAVAATAMRCVLVDHARRRHAAKRDGGARVTLVDGAAIEEGRPIDLLDLDEALTRLAAVHQRPARVVDLRFFGGLETEEVAEALGVSSATVKRDWRFAKAWLSRELSL
jgi:RNA polymerase sigma-70 factor, ECF subfamily